MWYRLFERLTENPVATLLALMLAVLVIRELWVLLRYKSSKLETVHEGQHQRLEADMQAHEGQHQRLEADMKATATAVHTLVLQQAAAAKELGVLEQRQSQLGGKLEGLQAFWRSEFDKLREEWRVEFREMSRTLHDDLQAHRQVVHDRLDRATAAMAQQTTEFLEHLEELLRKKD